GARLLGAELVDGDRTADADPRKHPWETLEREPRGRPGLARDAHDRPEERRANAVADLGADGEYLLGRETQRFAREVVRSRDRLWDPAARKNAADRRAMLR